MAKLAVTVTVFLFLFAVSNARNPLDQPENDLPVDPLITDSDPKTTTTTTLLLPIDIPESEAGTLPQSEYEVPESKLPERETKTTTPEEITGTDTDSVPLKMVSFHPINRHFPRRPFPPFRHRRPCRHHHHQFKPWGPRFHGLDQIPYGNDMILSVEEDDMGFDPVFRDGIRQVPARWMRFHHGGARFPRSRRDMAWTEDMRKPHHRRYVEGEENEREDHGVGFMKRFRKFLNHHF